MRTLTWAVGLLIMGLGSAANAQTAPASPLPPAPGPSEAETRPDPAVPRQPALALEELSTLNGRQGNTNTSIALSEQDLTALNHGNAVSANVVGSGQISIDRSAFSGFAGVGNFVINSGHNNNLQGALTINIVGQ